MINIDKMDMVLSDIEKSRATNRTDHDIDKILISNHSRKPTTV